MSTFGCILIVDDSETNVLILERSLRKHDFETLAAHDGFAAVDIARRQKPDLILLDVMMPGRDGLETCRILKGDPETASIPIIFVTAKSRSEDLLEAFKVGAADYVTKPFKIAEVVARSSVHVRLHQAEIELTHQKEESAALAARLSETNMRLARLSQIDSLTGLLNRRVWEEAARMEEARARRKDSSFAVLMVDVDYFKRFNDTHGHQAGDDCLRCVATAINDACRSVDMVGRFGGEEFVVLAPETDTAEALVLAERVRNAVWQLAIPHPAHTVAQRVTVSVGAAAKTRGAWEDLLREADSALYRAKDGGRNTVRAADENEPDVALPDASTAEPKATAASPHAASPIGNPLGHLTEDRTTFAAFEAFLQQLHTTVAAVSNAMAEQDVAILADTAQELSSQADPEGVSPIAHLAWKLRRSATVLNEMRQLSEDADALAKIGRSQVEGALPADGGAPAPRTP